MQLYDDQESAISLLRGSIKEKLKRPILAGPTGSGKTVISAKMMKNCQDADRKGWFFCDRIQLIEQSIKAFRNFGIEFGVRQASHPLHNPKATIQIASIQTMAAMIGKHGRNIPDMDLVIVDEANTQYEVIDKIMKAFNDIPIIGMDAAPFGKGLGKKYNNLVVATTTRELIAKGRLVPARYFGGEHVDLSKVRSVDANTYSQQDLAKATNDDRERLAGCIIRNWMEHGENSQTIAFSPTQDLSRDLVDRFNRNGISAEHVDCEFSAEDRKDLFEAHDRGEFRVLSCSRLLNTGYDAPSVRCIIDCYPIKSIATYVQRVGRGLRTHEESEKQYCIYLDHASNYKQFGGPAEDIVPTELHDGEKPHNETDLTNKDKKSSKTRECPQCIQLMSGRSCKACGYTVPSKEFLEDDGTMLVELTGNKANRKDSKAIKEQFYSELHAYAKTKDFKQGWAAVQYKAKYGCFPAGINAKAVTSIDMAKGWVKHQAIKKRYKKAS